MLIERDLDCGAIYERLRHQLVALVSALPPAARATRVPATPAWSVQDVLAHVVGIAAALNAQDFGPGNADDWTARQVESRRGRSVIELAAEWDREAPTFEDGLRLLGYAVGSHFVADLLQHTADVRHALGLGAVVDEAALTAGLDFYLDVAHRELMATDSGAVDVELPDGRATLGSGPVVATVAADRYELFRVLGARRSRQQVEALAWTGDAKRVIDHLAAYPLPLEDLHEPG